jgi:hypothetical protein
MKPSAGPVCMPCAMATSSPGNRISQALKPRSLWPGRLANNETISRCLRFGVPTATILSSGVRFRSASPESAHGRREIDLKIDAAATRSPIPANRLLSASTRLPHETCRPRQHRPFLPDAWPPYRRFRRRHRSHTRGTRRCTNGQPGPLESRERRKRDSERRGFRIVGNQPDAWTRESPTL